MAECSGKGRVFMAACQRFSNEIAPLQGKEAKGKERKRFFDVRKVGWGEMWPSESQSQWICGGVLVLGSCSIRKAVMRHEVRKEMNFSSVLGGSSKVEV